MKESSVSFNFAFARFGPLVGKLLVTNNASHQPGHQLHIAHHDILRHTNKQSIKQWTNAIILKRKLVAWDAWTYKIGLGPYEGRTYGLALISGVQPQIEL